MSLINQGFGGDAAQQGNIESIQTLLRYKISNNQRMWMMLHPLDLKAT